MKTNSARTRARVEFRKPLTTAANHPTRKGLRKNGVRLHISARYYDAEIGRWISRDPLGFDAGDSNLYRYTRNRPTVATDPSGLTEDRILSRPPPFSIDPNNDSREDIIKHAKWYAATQARYKKLESLPARGRGAWYHAGRWIEDNVWNRPVRGLLDGTSKVINDIGGAGGHHWNVDIVVGFEQYGANWQKVVDAGWEANLVAIADPVIGLFVPGGGEAQDMQLLVDPKSTNLERTLAVGSLVLSYFTLGLSPNFGTFMRHGDDLANAGRHVPSIVAPVTRTGPVSQLEVGPYRDLARRSVGDGLTPDHIPSFAAVRANVERQLGRPLTAAEARTLRDQTNTIIIRTRTHQQSSRTYGGRNTAQQIQTDSQNLQAAFQADRAALRQRLIQEGHSPEAVDAAFQQLDQLNRQAGRY